MGKRKMSIEKEIERAVKRTIALDKDTPYKSAAEQEKIISDIKSAFNDAIWTHIAAVQHHIVAHIDAHMGNARCVVCADKEDKIPRLHIGAGNKRTDIVKPLRTQPPSVDKSAVCENITDESRTVKGSGRV